jgi:hypothetical protein
MAEKTKAAAKPKTKAAPVKEKAVMGRPSSYRPEYCDAAIELGKQGKSPAGIASFLGVSRQLLYDWAKLYPDFSTAMEKSVTFAQDYWEQKGEDNIGTPGFNSGVYKLFMTARFRHDYMEIKKTEVSGPEGGAIEVKDVTTIDASTLTPEQRDALRAVLLATKG